MLCHPEPHPEASYALYIAKSPLTVNCGFSFTEGLSSQTRTLHHKSPPTQSGG